MIKTDLIPGDYVFCVKTVPNEYNAFTHARAYRIESVTEDSILAYNDEGVLHSIYVPNTIMPPGSRHHNAACLHGVFLTEEALCAHVISLIDSHRDFKAYNGEEGEAVHEPSVLY